MKMPQKGCSGYESGDLVFHEIDYIRPRSIAPICKIWQKMLNRSSKVEINISPRLRIEDYLLNNKQYDVAFLLAAAGRGHVIHYRTGSYFFVPHLVGVQSSYTPALLPATIVILNPQLQT